MIMQTRRSLSRPRTSGSLLLEAVFLVPGWAWFPIHLNSPRWGFIFIFCFINNKILRFSLPKNFLKQSYDVGWYMKKKKCLQNTNWRHDLCSQCNKHIVFYTFRFSSMLEIKRLNLNDTRRQNSLVTHCRPHDHNP
jgi:hypothetical protein